MKEWEPASKIAADEFSSANSVSLQIGPFKFMPRRTEVSLNIDAQRSMYLLDDGPERQYARNEAAESLCFNVAAVVEDATKGSGMDEGLAPLLFMACRSIAGALETAEEAVVQKFYGDSVRHVVAALKFMRQRCCCPRDMTQMH